MTLPPESMGREQRGFLLQAMLQGMPAASRRDEAISYVPLPAETHPANLLLAGRTEGDCIWRQGPCGYHGVSEVLQGMVPLQNEEEANKRGGVV